VIIQSYWMQISAYCNADDKVKDKMGQRAIDINNSYSQCSCHTGEDELKGRTKVPIC